jgi:hypothetical protein
MRISSFWGDWSLSQYKQVQEGAEVAANRDKLCTLTYAAFGVGQ